MESRPYRLPSVWHVPADARRTWDVLTDPAMTWPRWWPHVTAPEVRPAAGLVGSRAVLALRAARWSYALRFAVEITAADPPRTAELRVAGDLRGTGRVRVVGAGAGSIVHIAWDVATTRPWMTVAAPLLGPVFEAAHARAMAAGERGLAGYLSPAGRPASGPTSPRATGRSPVRPSRP